MIKKYFFCLLFFLISFLTFSQSRVNAGASLNIGFPAGYFNEVANTGVGGSVIGEYVFNRKISTTLSVSYQNYPGDFPLYAIQGRVIDVSLNSIPILAGVRYYFSEEFFGALEAGVHFFRVNTDVSDLYSDQVYSTKYLAKYSGGIRAGYRYRLSNESVLEFSSIYQVVEDNFNSVALSLSILILLDNL
jgi:hypothetical protein